MNYVIEKGIPLPSGGAGRIPKYPFRSMEVGDSFFSVEKSARVSACQWARREGSGVKFVTAKEGNGLRIWRVA